MQLMLNLDRILNDRLTKDGKRLTQVELARLTGIPQGTISKWIGNKVDRYDGDIIKRLCYVLRCTPSDLLILDWEGEMPEWDGAPVPYPSRES